MQKFDLTDVIMQALLPGLMQPSFRSNADHTGTIYRRPGTRAHRRWRKVRAAGRR